ncbi:MAG: thymidylate kinase [Clostridium sp.]|jgi:dTMP kinase|nr:thymidylate kinase [Clostridium sp.]
MVKGKLLVLEGLDGSGKSTQMALLGRHMDELGLSWRHIKLPDYESPACAGVKLYLAGELGGKPEDVNAYAASALYAMDRFVSYRTKWRGDYENGVILLADRYSSSNAYHQMAKLPPQAWDGFLEWLDDYEHEKLGLPRPSLVIYLDMPVELSQSLMRDRGELDIHERDVGYLIKCREAAIYAAKKWGWRVIPCHHDGEILSIEHIRNEIFGLLGSFLED